MRWPPKNQTIARNRRWRCLPPGNAATNDSSGSSTTRRSKNTPRCHGVVDGRNPGLSMATNPQAATQNRSRLLAALYIAQEQYGWLSPQAIQRVAGRLGLSPGQVRATASFYTMFKLEPQGKYRIQVCEGLSCYLVDGAETIIDHVSRKLKIKPGGTTPDGRFTLEVVQCIASCGTAPALRINDELYERMTLESIDALLERLGSE
ncbi:MAG: NAD(P)H-dependent oxidoreductase subunit E [Chloroflexi bacterium]|nr:NAD(P)H-dependent oxidoreductase subunit E [Chloroflexota bacterium]